MEGKSNSTGGAAPLKLQRRLQSPGPSKSTPPIPSFLTKGERGSMQAALSSALWKSEPQTYIVTRKAFSALCQSNPIKYSKVNHSHSNHSSSAMETNGKYFKHMKREHYCNQSYWRCPNWVALLSKGTSPTPIWPDLIVRTTAPHPGLKWDCKMPTGRGFDCRQFSPHYLRCFWPG